MYSVQTTIHSVLFMKHNIKCQMKYLHKNLGRLLLQTVHEVYRHTETYKTGWRFLSISLDLLDLSLNK